MNCFGQKLPLILASTLFVVLVFHISFEVWELVCEAIRTDVSLSEITLTILKQTIQKIGSDAVRNLSLLLAASIGWFFLYWRAKTTDLNAEAAEKSAEAARKNTETAEKGLTTERFTRAIEQLASEDLSTRLGGILGLEQIAMLYEEEREKIKTILTTRIHEIDQKAKQERKPGEIPRTGYPKEYYKQNNLKDIEFAIKALSNILSCYEPEYMMYCDLRGIDLYNLFFVGTDMSRFRLMNVDLSWSVMVEANFLGVDLDGSNLTHANTRYANFSCASLTGTNLTEILLHMGDLSNANLTGANLTSAVLSEVDVSSANFQDVKGLTQKQIDETYYVKGHPPRNLPDGLKLPPGRVRKEIL